MLSEHDREALTVALRAEVLHKAGCTCCPGLVEDLAPAVEQIIARHVAAALTEAADAIDEESERVGGMYAGDVTEFIRRNLAAKPT